MSTIARLSLEQYDEMIRCGVLERGGQQRLEFIRGEIRELTPMGPRHEDVVDRLTIWCAENLPKEKVRLRVQNSIGIPGLESAPEPDIAWVIQGDYSDRRPTAAETLLIIEVAESSLAYDSGEKAELYAAGGIADYWIVNLVHRWIEVRRDPAGGRYRSLQTFSDDDEVRPLELADLAIRPSMLW